MLDCRMGSGVIWKRLREEIKVASYWGVDLKAKKGRLKLDSIRILQQPGLKENIIDIDTYGSPWKHWLALLPNIAHDVTVFLTLGQLQTGTVGSVGDDALLAAGFKFPTLKIPQGFHVKLRDIFPYYLLAKGQTDAIMITEAVEAVSDGNARYVGVRIKKTNGPDAENTKPAQSTKAE